MSPIKLFTTKKWVTVFLQWRRRPFPHAQTSSSFLFFKGGEGAHCPRLLLTYYLCTCSYLHFYTYIFIPTFYSYIFIPTFLYLHFKPTFYSYIFIPTFLYLHFYTYIFMLTFLTYIFISTFLYLGTLIST